MIKQFHPFGFGFTVILTLLFLILSPSTIIDNQGIVITIIFTSLGIIVIWIVYFIRSYIFSKFSSNEDEINEKP